MFRLSDSSLTKIFLATYAIGLIVCLCFPIILQLTLDMVVTNSLKLPNDIVQNLGYAFTGIIITGALFMMRRWNRIRSDFSKLTTKRQNFVMVREILLYSAITSISSILGVGYYALGGISVKHFARNFITMTPIMFLIFVPRLHAWRKAAK